MSMRIKDEAKVTAISQAVFQITKQEGLNNASISKIAKLAGVSPATVYIYYQDKSDMLSKIYLQVKELMDRGLAEKLQSETNVKAQIRISMQHFASRFREYPDEAQFMRAIQSNPQFVTSETHQIADEIAKPLNDVIEYAIANNLLVTQNQDIIYVFFAAPLAFLIETRQVHDRMTTNEEIEELIEIVVQSLCAD